MKKMIISIIIVVVIAAAGLAGWYLFFKNNSEGGNCNSDKQCENSLKCVNKTCSSGKTGSVCSAKTDCQTNFCVSGKCTNGQENDACITYKDCDKNLLCQKGLCSIRPDYSKYFDKIVISKMKPGMPPGPDNPTIVTNEFSKNDGIEIDFRGVKSETIGDYYIEIVNATTGEVENSTANMDTKFEGRDTGMGTDLQILLLGIYDLNVYFKNGLIYTTQIIIK